MMDFSMIGSLGSYTKNLRLQSRWEQKKASGDVTAHMDARGNLKPRKTEIASMYQQQINEERESGADPEKLAEIMDKVTNGKKLTPEEEKILQAEDPVIYARYRSTEDERKGYEQELKRCKTKGEVQRVKMAHMNSTLMAAKSIANNPNIPDDKKKILLGIEKSRTDKLNTATNAFVKKGEYAKLPTDQEKAEAEKELRELRETERHPETEEIRDKEKAEAELTLESEETETERAVKALDGKADTGSAAEKTDLKKAAKPKTEAQLAASSPEFRKTRRAKAKAVYTAIQNGENPEPTVRIDA